MHKVLVNRLGGLSLPRKSVVRLTDRLDMTLDVYRGRKTTIQQQLSFCEVSSNLLQYFFKLWLRHKLLWMDVWCDFYMPPKIPSWA